MDDMLSAKKAVRDRILMERCGMGKDERALKSAAICALIEGISEYAKAGSILFYMPFRGEVDVAKLMDSALKKGLICALPKCGRNCSLRLFTISDIATDVEPGAWGIPEPIEGKANECTLESFSVIIVPGVAYDRQGKRIGYGRGYYDRLLAVAGRDTLKIAPAFSFQVQQELPYEQYDIPVDIIVTEEEIIDCRKAGGEFHG